MRGHLQILSGVLALLCGRATLAAMQPVVLSTTTYRVTVSQEGTQYRESFAVSTKDGWKPVLEASPAIRVMTSAGAAVCAIDSVDRVPHGLLVHGGCGKGRFEQHLTESAQGDVLDVATRFEAEEGVVLNSVEDRYNFLPTRNAVIDDKSGPLDFVWSQNIKSEAADLVASTQFKSPVIMMQQGNLFAAILAQPDDRHREPRAFDLDVTSGATPWMSFGAISFEPHGHSYFRRSVSGEVPQIARTVEFRYKLLLSEQAPRQGYRRATRLLWQTLGHPELLRSGDEQRNVLRPELQSFDSWRREAWKTETSRIYQGWECGAVQCGTLKSDRSVTGDWQHPSSDAWFNPWFETLRTAYGWYLHGRDAGDLVVQHDAETILNLALSAPRKGGAFPTIYLLPGKKWVASDGWAGYEDSYSTFSMSWTAYWMLRWAQDLVPGRRSEIITFVRGYGDFLVHQQKATGVIPSWFRETNLEPRPEFADFNGEGPPTALFLATLSSVTGDARYEAAAEKAMGFVTREVVPRERWFDFETFLSCARKPYDFYDPWTAQFPGNNLAEIQAPEAMLALFHLTGRRTYLEQGVAMLDYLLLTQQVWNNPQFTPVLLGGFTTQNTDAEWSDARQAYAANVLLDYYLETGTIEYLERAVVAARSTFAVAPWENWAHTGFVDEPGALTGFHWGTGSAMTSVEMMQPVLGDALIDVSAAEGVGFDECTVTGVEINATSITFQLDSSDSTRNFLVRFRGLQPDLTYTVSWNHHVAVRHTGQELIRDGLRVGPSAAVELGRAPLQAVY